MLIIQLKQKKVNSFKYLNDKIIRIKLKNKILLHYLFKC